jgi:hypothetical protein
VPSTGGEIGSPVKFSAGSLRFWATSHEVSPGTTLMKNSCGLVSVTILRISDIDAFAGIRYCPGISPLLRSPSSLSATRSTTGCITPSWVKP